MGTLYSALSSFHTLMILLHFSRQSYYGVSDSRGLSLNVSESRGVSDSRGLCLNVSESGGVSDGRGLCLNVSESHGVSDDAHTAGWKNWIKDGRWWNNDAFYDLDSPLSAENSEGEFCNSYSSPCSVLIYTTNSSLCSLPPTPVIVLYWYTDSSSLFCTDIYHQLQSLFCTDIPTARHCSVLIYTTNSSLCSVLIYRQLVIVLYWYIPPTPVIVLSDIPITRHCSVLIYTTNSSHCSVLIYRQLVIALYWYIPPTPVFIMYWYNNNLFFYLLLFQTEAHGSLQSKEPKHSQNKVPRDESVAAIVSDHLTIVSDHLTIVSDHLTARETVPDRRCSIRKSSLTKRVRAHRGKTGNGSIRRRA